MTIEEVTLLCNEGSVRWTKHILERLFSRGISLEDVKYVLQNGVIIEQYPTDYPFPSCLVFGYTKTKKALHVVCGSNKKELWFITAYFPDPNEWTDDFKKRRF